MNLYKIRMKHNDHCFNLSLYAQNESKAMKAAETICRTATAKYAKQIIKKG